MGALRILLIIFLAVGLISCSSNKPKPEKLPDVTEASLDTPSDVTENTGETTEQDLAALNNEKQNPADQQNLDVSDEFNNQTAENKPEQSSEQAQNPPPPESDAATPTPLVPTETAAPTDKPATITALDFNANENGGTINVKTNREVTFTTRKNDKTNQFIIELENTIVPKRFKRPYVTKEFPGAISNVQAYQAKGAQKTARIVVQLRDAVEPSVSQNSNVLSIAASGMATSEEQPVAQQETQQETTDTNEEQAEAEPTVAQDPQIMSNKSFDSFLLGQNKFYGKKISIEVTNQDVREVFKFISEESGLNIILDDDVTGKATMKLRKVPWDQALAILLQSKQLGYIRNGSILRVASLKTLKSESLAAREVMDAQKNLQNVRVQVYPISYAKSDELATQVKDLLTPRGKATADKRTNTLVVSDIPEVLSKVKSLVTKLDTQTPQVLIEAKVIEARDTFSRIVGVKWGASGGSTNMGVGAGQRNIELGTSLTSDYIHSGTATSLGLSIGNLDVVGNLTTTLQLLESENQIKVLSAPRIIALDRVEATIEQTTQFPITTTTTTSTSTTVSASFQDLKLQLKVKPQITADGGVIMDVNIMRDIRGQTTSSSTGAIEVGKRTATTQVLVENGDTVAIGGIYQSDASVSNQGIPWLSKIPLLGWLFKSNSITRDKNELVILITPRILNREKAFVKAEESL